MPETLSHPHLDGIIPEETDPLFLSQHMAAYAFARRLMAGKKVLEIGFGEGYGSDFLAQEAAHVTGIDMAPGNAGRAARKYPRPNLTFLHMEGTRLDFPDGTFDAASSFQVIEHIAENAVTDHLREVARVLKPGGIYFVSTLNVENAMKPGKPYTRMACHLKEYTAPELKAALEKVFPSVAVHGLYRRWPQLLARRLKRWGLDRWGPRSWNPIKRYYARITVEAYETRPVVSRTATDLFAVCRKGEK